MIITSTPPLALGAVGGLRGDRANTPVTVESRRWCRGLHAAEEASFTIDGRAPGLGGIVLLLDHLDLSFDQLTSLIFSLEVMKQSLGKTMAFRSNQRRKSMRVRRGSGSLARAP